MRRQRGFTLMELMIVVAIVAILAAIALPSYQEYVRAGRRGDAMNQVGSLQMALERWRAENPSFANCTGSPCGSGTYPTVPDATASPYYSLAISGASGSAYTITATPRSGSAQAGDRCGNFTLTNTGVRGVATGTLGSGTTAEECWNK